MPDTDKSKASILVASESIDDAGQVVQRLSPDFENVNTTVGEAASARDYGRFEPAVLVLAFRGVDRAEHFMLGLLRSCPEAHSKPCRSILLCSKEEVPRAFELCRKGYFDDYVLHWPMAFDGMRLAMSVWLACRETPRPEARQGVPQAGELISHVRHLDAVGAEIDHGLTTDQKMRLEPHMAQVRHFADKVRTMRLPVLVVEDDQLACQLMEQALRDEPIDLAFVANGDAALLSLKHQRPQVILMDVRLPGIDGVALTRAIKRIPELADIPIVMLTGSARRETVTASIAAGAESFLVKPVTRDALIAKLRQFMAPPAPAHISVVPPT